MKEKIIGDDIEGEYVYDPEFVRGSLERIRSRELDDEQWIDLLMDITSEPPPEMSKDQEKFEDELSESGERDLREYAEKELGLDLSRIPDGQVICIQLPGVSSVSYVAQKGDRYEPGKPKDLSREDSQDLQDLKNNGQRQQGDTPELPETKFLRVSELPETHFLRVSGLPETKFLPVPVQVEENPVKTKRVLIPLHNYHKWFAPDKSKSTIYRQIHSLTFPFPLFGKIVNGRNRYYVEISDPRMIEAAVLNTSVKEMIKPCENRLLHVQIKIPSEDLKLLKLIVPNSYHYGHFMKFVESELKEKSELPPIKLRRDKVEFTRTAINVLEEDYKKFLQVSENNDKNISDVVMAFLESYLETQYRTIIDKSPKK